jgi:hypothetical protein
MPCITLNLHPERAADYLEKAIDERDPMVIFLPPIPFWARVRTLSRGPALLRKLNYPKLY